MTTKRSYTRRTKTQAIIAAELTSQAKASAAMGIPRTTLSDWMAQPWAAELRAKTRDDLADEAKVMAHRTLMAIATRIDEFEPRDLAILFGVMVDKAQLLSGAATNRTESRDITGTLSDSELIEALREAERLTGRAAPAGEGEAEG